MNELRHPFVSVVIPVFNDPERLPICLEALEAQTYPAARYEVIVVDNGSDHSINDLVSRFSQARVVVENRPGSYAARNAGISLANGDVIAFTDADCIPARDWIEKGVQTLLTTPNCGLVGGRVDIVFENSNRPTAVQLYEQHFAFLQDLHISKYRFASTANVFTLRRVIEDVGAFDDGLKSTGDAEWGQRVASHGYHLVCGRDAVVAHPARSTLKQVCSRARRIAGGVHDRNQRRRFPLILLIGNVLWDIASLIFAPIQIYVDRRLPSTRQKCEVLFMVEVLRIVLIHERISLALGKHSQRE